MRIPEHDVTYYRYAAGANFPQTDYHRTVTVSVIAAKTGSKMQLDSDTNPFALCREFSQAGTDQQTARLDEKTSCIKTLQPLSANVKLAC